MKAPSHKALLMSEQLYIHGKVLESDYTLKELEEAVRLAEFMKELNEEGVNFQL